jgi:ribosomal protein S18 acetylase RimI-like enzyme
MGDRNTGTELLVRPFEDGDEGRAIEIWHACDLVVPWNDPNRDIELKLRVQPELFLVGELSGEIVATAMVGYDGHRGWVNYLGVDPAFRRRGVGRRMMQEAEARLRKLGCPKLNLHVRTSNKPVLAFYESLGFTVNDVLSLGKML